MKRPGYYVLDGHTPREVDDLREWASIFEGTERIVGSTMIGETRVSTVFLGLDHRFGEGEPLLFETMIFGGVHADWQERCSTWEEAEKMHEQACALVRASLQ